MERIQSTTSKYMNFELSSFSGNHILIIPQVCHSWVYFDEKWTSYFLKHLTQTDLSPLIYVLAGHCECFCPYVHDRCMTSSSGDITPCIKILMHLLL